MQLSLFGNSMKIIFFLLNVRCWYKYIIHCMVMCIICTGAGLICGMWILSMVWANCFFVLLIFTYSLSRREWKCILHRTWTMNMHVETQQINRIENGRRSKWKHKGIMREYSCDSRFSGKHVGLVHVFS